MPRSLNRLGETQQSISTPVHRRSWYCLVFRDRVLINTLGMSAYDPTQPSQLQPNSVLNVCEGFDCTSNDQVPRSLCLSCGSTYCDNCWDKQGPHRPGKVGVDGLPHEKTKKPIYDRLKTIFEPPEDSNELSRLHIEDEDTTWFGVEKDSGGRPMFQDYGRYAALMAETKQPSSGVRYPQLVSFIGQTGSCMPI